MKSHIVKAEDTKVRDVISEEFAEHNFLELYNVNNTKKITSMKWDGKELYEFYDTYFERYTNRDHVIFEDYPEKNFREAVLSLFGNRNVDASDVWMTINHFMLINFVKMLSDGNDIGEVSQIFELLDPDNELIKSISDGNFSILKNSISICRRFIELIQNNKEYPSAENIVNNMEKIPNIDRFIRIYLRLFIPTEYLGDDKFEYLLDLVKHVVSGMTKGNTSMVETNIEDYFKTHPEKRELGLETNFEELVESYNKSD